MASQVGMRLSRNNCGRLRDKWGSYVSFGVFSPGGSDLIGFTPVTITAEHVGRKVAVFTAVELKCGKTKVTSTQHHFIESVKENGGIAVIARDEITTEELRVLTGLHRPIF